MQDVVVVLILADAVFILQIVILFLLLRRLDRMSIRLDELRQRVEWLETKGQQPPPYRPPSGGPHWPWRRGQSPP